MVRRSGSVAAGAQPAAEPFVKPENTGQPVGAQAAARHKAKAAPWERPAERLVAVRLRLVRSGPK
jgi:hypothetical protein